MEASGLWGGVFILNYCQCKIYFNNFQLNYQFHLKEVKNDRKQHFSTIH